MSKKATRLKRSCALHQIEIKCLILSHKTSMFEKLLLKVQKLCPNQILPIIASIAHYRKNLASFFLPKTSKTCQQELILSCKAHPTVTKDNKRGIP